MELYFNLLKRNSPERGYYPEPTKIIMIVHPENIEVGKLFDVSVGLRFSLVHVILAVISGIKIQT